MTEADARINQIDQLRRIRALLASIRKKIAARADRDADMAELLDLIIVCDELAADVDRRTN